MNDTKDEPVEGDYLPIARVARVGEYFKSLFVRSLKLGLDDGVRERPWEDPAAPAGHTHAVERIEADAGRQAANGASDRETGEALEKESA